MDDNMIKWSHRSNLNEFISPTAGSAKLPDGLTEQDIVALEVIENSLYMFTKDAIYQLCDFEKKKPVFVKVIEN